MKKTLIIALFISMTALSAQSAVIKAPATADLPKPTQKAIVEPTTQPTSSVPSTQQTSSGSSATNIDPKTVRTWNAKCASCHGEDGKGQTTKGKSMAISDFSMAAWQNSFTNEKIKKAIEDGVKRDKNGVHQQMDAFAEKLKPEQIDELVLMVRSFGK